MTGAGEPLVTKGQQNNKIIPNEFMLPAPRQEPAQPVTRPARPPDGDL